MPHVPFTVLQRFAAGTASREENRQVVCHLLGRCEGCAAAIRIALVPRVSEAEHAAAIDRVFDRFLADRELRGALELALLEVG
jgi:hypothetical protein